MSNNANNLEVKSIKQFTDIKELLELRERMAKLEPHFINGEEPVNEEDAKFFNMIQNGTKDDFNHYLKSVKDKDMREALSDIYGTVNKRERIAQAQEVKNSYRHRLNEIKGLMDNKTNSDYEYLFNPVKALTEAKKAFTNLTATALTVKAMMDKGIAEQILKEGAGLTKKEEKGLQKALEKADDISDKQVQAFEFKNSHLINTQSVALKVAVEGLTDRGGKVQEELKGHFGGALRSSNSNIEAIKIALNQVANTHNSEFAKRFQNAFIDTKKEDAVIKGFQNEGKDVYKALLESNLSADMKKRVLEIHATNEMIGAKMSGDISGFDEAYKRLEETNLKLNDVNSYNINGLYELSKSYGELNESANANLKSDEQSQKEASSIKDNIKNKESEQNQEEPKQSKGAYYEQ